MMAKLLILLIASLLIGCGAKKGEFFCEPTNEPKDIKYQAIEFEPVQLDSINTSYEGITIQKRDKILFVDKLFAFIYEFDGNGKLLARHGGVGESAKEFPVSQIEICSVNSNDELFLFDASNNWVVCDDSYIRKTYNGAYLNCSYAINNDSKYDCINSYVFAYSNLVMKSYGDYAYVNLIADGGEKGFSIFSPDFTAETRIIAQIDFKEAKVLKTLGRLTPEFGKSEGNSFSYTKFDIDQTNGDFYVGFEIDSLIYVYDKDYNIKRSFGYSGVNMDVKYSKLIDITDLRSNYRTYRRTKGYYNKLALVDGKLFRSYKKGSHSQYDGLQIYDNDVLIADVETPKNANVVAYIAPYYYCEIICDEAAETLTLYRFKLN